MPTISGWFLQTSVPHIPKMALCFSIFERGSATASVQLLHASGAPWKRALQESFFAGSWMRWKRITKYRASCSSATSLGIYPSWNKLGSFNGTACFTGPRPPGRGVDMFRNTWCASARTELSNAPAAWTCDSRETLSETRTSMLDLSANHSCIPPCGCGSRWKDLPQHALGVIIFCRCPRPLPFNAHGLADGRLAREGIYLLMT